MHYGEIINACGKSRWLYIKLYENLLQLWKIAVVFKEGFCCFSIQSYMYVVCTRVFTCRLTLLSSVCEMFEWPIVEYLSPINKFSDNLLHAINTHIQVRSSQLASAQKRFRLLLSAGQQQLAPSFVFIQHFMIHPPILSLHELILIQCKLVNSNL